jgi:hypothetical protein
LTKSSKKETLNSPNLSPINRKNNSQLNTSVSPTEFSTSNESIRFNTVNFDLGQDTGYQTFAGGQISTDLSLRSSPIMKSEMNCSKRMEKSNNNNKLNKTVLEDESNSILIDNKSPSTISNLNF